MTRTRQGGPHAADVWSMSAIGLTVITLFLLLIGLLMSFSASIVDAAQEGDAFGIFRRQGVWAAIGVPVYVVASRIPRSLLRGIAFDYITLSVDKNLCEIPLNGLGSKNAGCCRLQV
jgi:cell division protein FtsW